MTNFEKYKTPREAFEAFTECCHNVKSGCEECPYNGCDVSCYFMWLYTDLKDKKPTPQWQSNILNKFTTKE